MADENKELMAALMKEIASVKAKLAEGALSGEEIEKRASAIADKQFKLREAEILSKMRKGSYADQEVDDKDIPEVLVEKSDSPKVREFQRFNDDVLILSKALGCHATALKMWNKQAGKHTELRKAMDSQTAAAGLEWVPTNFSSDLIDRFRLARQVSALFPEIQMPSDPYKLPALTGDLTAYKVAEVTAADPSTKSYTASNVTTAARTLNASKMGARIQWSTELQEDSIIPVLELYKNQLSIAMAYGLEDSLLNGDTTATHMDADVTSSADVRKLWKGLRKLTQTANDQSLSTLSNSNLRALRAKMGKYGARPSELVIIVSPKVYLKLLDLSDVITMDKYGDRATVVQGELAKIDGISIVVSEAMRDGLNASGVNDATTNNKGILLIAKPSCFVVGKKRSMTVKFFEDVQNDISYLVGSWRGDFQPLYDETAEPIVVKGVNITI